MENQILKFGWFLFGAARRMKRNFFGFLQKKHRLRILQRGLISTCVHRSFFALALVPAPPLLPLHRRTIDLGNGYTACLVQAGVHKNQGKKQNGRPDSAGRPFV